MVQRGDDSALDLRARAAAIRFALGEESTDGVLTAEDVRRTRRQLEDADANLMRYVEVQQRMARLAGLLELVGKNDLSTVTRAFQQGLERDLQKAKGKIQNWPEEKTPELATLRLYERLCVHEATLLFAQRRDE